MTRRRLPERTLPRVRERLRSAAAEPWLWDVLLLWGPLTVTAFTLLRHGLDPDLIRTIAPGALAVTAVVVVIAALVRRGTWLLFALLGSWLALVSPDEPAISPAVAAVVWIAVANDPHRTSWISLLITAVGGVVPMVVDEPTPETAVAVLVGGVSGMLVKEARRARWLEQQTETLTARSRRSEEQARWQAQRTALARELHDVVGHHVTAMVVQAEAGLVHDRDAALRQVARSGRAALTELDTLVVHLRDPDAPDEATHRPRLTDIEGELAAGLRAQGVRVEVRVDPCPDLDDSGALTLYRVAQEALTNVSRHARAQHVTVEVSEVGGDVLLRVADDGVGIGSPPSGPPDGGSGLVGIGERLTARGGSAAIGGGPDGGTVLEARIPSTVPA